MVERILTGTRIRDRRLAQGRRQGDLARAVGISPSYLNLIEHNRRRIGGKLLSDIAQELDTDMAALAQERDVSTVNALIAGLKPLSQGRAPGQAAPEADRIEEFCARFPGWAAGVIRLLARNERLERIVGALSDRLAHDPHLSAALHEVLSRVTAIHATSSILRDSEDLDANWHKRFQNNLHEDAEKLSGSVQALVDYLDQAGAQERGLVSPQDELENYLARQKYHLETLETGTPPSDLPFTSDDARARATAYFQSYAADAAVLPLDRLEAAIETHGLDDPFAIANALEVPVHRVMRRIATLPGREIGRVSCDGAGALLFRKPISGFEIPRLGAACSLWPLYDALRSPARPVVARIVQNGREDRAFRAVAYADARFPAGARGPEVVTAEMLVMPVERSDEDRPVGSNCRICSLLECPARREVSLLGDAAA